MQILRAAGLPWAGEAFSSNWRETIGEANPEGFFESRFRDGINFLTNPDPETGEYVHPADVRMHAVKIFVPGLTRTDLAYVDKVVACVRDVREYCASFARLRSMESAATSLPGRELPAHLSWWRENHALLIDALTRRYPLFVVSYARIIGEPDITVRELVRFLGAGDEVGALSAVNPSLRHFDRASLSSPEVDRAHLASFDALYELFDSRGTVDDALLDRFAATERALAPAISAALGED